MPSNADEAEEASGDEELTFNDNPDEDKPQTEHTPFSTDDIETSIRSSSERTVLTITEDEPYAPVDDEANSMEMDSFEEHHIFTFEKKSHHDKNGRRSTAQSLESDMNSKDTESQYSSGRSSRKDRCDKNEWISSFDVQMKCAMNKLNELV